MLCRLAGCPTRTSPSSVKAAMEGVVRQPSAFSITLGLLPSITATHELVVPRSIPMALVMTYLLSVSVFRSQEQPDEGARLHRSREDDAPCTGGTRRARWNSSRLAAVQDLWN